MNLHFSVSVLLLCLQQISADNNILTPEQAKKLNPETGLYKIHNDEVITNKYKIEVKGGNGITIGCYGYQQLDGSWQATNYISNDFEGYKTLNDLNKPITVEPESGKSFTLVFSEILPKCGSFWDEHIKVHPHTLDFKSSGSNQIPRIQTPQPAIKIIKTPAPTVSTYTTKQPTAKKYTPTRSPNDLNGQGNLLGPARFLSVLSPQSKADKETGKPNSLSGGGRTTKQPYTPYKPPVASVNRPISNIPASHPSAAGKFPLTLIHSTRAEKPLTGSKPTPSRPQTTTTTTTRKPYSPTASGSSPKPRYQPATSTPTPTGYPSKYVPSGSKLTETTCTPEYPNSVIFGALSDIQQNDEPLPISFDHCTCTCPNIRKIPKVILQGKG